MKAAFGVESATGVGVPEFEVIQNMLSGLTALNAVHLVGSAGGVGGTGGFASGGAIYADGATVAVTGSVFCGNSAIGGTGGYAV